MKKHIVTLFLIVPFITFYSCNNPTNTEKPVVLETIKDSASYAIGIRVGRNIKEDTTLNKDAIMHGLNTAMKGEDSSMTDQDIQAIMLAYQQEMVNKEASPNIEKGKAFLAANKTKEGVKELPTGLQYKIIEEGTGISPQPTDEVKVHYTGKLIDGSVFDSSIERGEPIVFPLNRVIQGWQQGLQLMKEGAKYELYIPAELGYGNRAQPNIPAGSTLIFEVELIKVNPGKE